MRAGGTRPPHGHDVGEGLAPPALAVCSLFPGRGKPLPYTGYTISNSSHTTGISGENSNPASASSARKKSSCTRRQ